MEFFKEIKIFFLFYYDLYILKLFFSEKNKFHKNHKNPTAIISNTVFFLINGPGRLFFDYPRRGAVY
jgi:hypothetical protein